MIPVYKIVNTKSDNNSHKNDREEHWSIQCIAEFPTIVEAQQCVITKMATDPNTMGHFTTLLMDYERDLANPDLWSANRFDSSSSTIAQKLTQFKDDYCFNLDKYLGYRRYFYGQKPNLAAVAKAANILYLKKQQ